ncbi:hypothetical protein WA026_012780 [Henosepilachna vigintioctopunctata]|uniref:Uncharacterized protein n=1 Tax=Henosepilachna vigintioctopunctata TaxID=420089 RepID=A0AAW1TXY6_9CUCU
MNLQEINAVCSKVDAKPLEKLKDLPIGVVYPILKLKIINGHYGESILVETEDFKVFLPRRVTEVFRPLIANFTPAKYGFRSLGIQEIGHFSPSTKFEIVEI